MITQDRLKEALHYDQNTGVWRWRIDKRNGKAGDKAGTIASTGYHSIWIGGKSHISARLAWLYMLNRWPKYQIEYINGDKLDLRWANLREHAPKPKPKPVAPAEPDLPDPLAEPDQDGMWVDVVDLEKGGYQTCIRFRHPPHKVIKLGPFDTRDEAEDAGTTHMVELRVLKRIGASQ